MHSEDYHIFHFTSFIWICIFEQQSQFHFRNLCQEIWGKFSFGTVALNSNTRRADVPFSCFSNLHEINMRERERGRGKDKGSLMIAFKLPNLTSSPFPFFLSLQLQTQIQNAFSCQRSSRRSQSQTTLF